MIAGWSSLVARRAHNPKVVGSNPAPATTLDLETACEQFHKKARLVWAFSRNPFDYTLWSVIKGVAGDSGECFLTTEDLAYLSMMSMGQVSDSRKYWMSIGFIFGDFKRDPGYPQPVWHMRIPNIWKANIEWAEKYASIKERVQYKRAQADKLRLERAEKRRKQEENTRLHQMKVSPGEGGVTPGEGGVTPGETKNNHKKNQKNSVSAKADESAGQVNPNTGNRTDAVVKGDGMDGILFYARQAAAINAELENRINAFPRGRCSGRWAHPARPSLPPTLLPARRVGMPRESRGSRRSPSKIRERRGPRAAPIWSHSRRGS